MVLMMVIAAEMTVTRILKNAAIRIPPFILIYSVRVYAVLRDDGADDGDSCGDDGDEDFEECCHENPSFHIGFCVDYSSMVVTALTISIAASRSATMILPISFSPMRNASFRMIFSFQGGICLSLLSVYSITQIITKSQTKKGEKNEPLLK